MNIYKLKTGVNMAKIINLANFIYDTKEKFPYYTSDERQFAICPHCENPIQIIGLYTARTRKPYGKHYPKSVPSLAEYSRVAYENCPYANPNRKLTNQSIKSADDGISIQIKRLVKENFDRIVMILEDIFEIKLSENILRRMLQKYRDNNGHRYIGATLVNYPWTFAFMTWRQSIFGMFLKKNTKLYEALGNSPDVYIDNGQISTKDKYLKIAYYCPEHKFPQESADETLKYLVVTEDSNNEDKIVYKKIVTLDYDKYENIKKTILPNHSRNQKLLTLAEEYL